jgi:hypothetical protein
VSCTFIILERSEKSPNYHLERSEKSLICHSVRAASLKAKRNEESPNCHSERSEESPALEFSP